MRKQQLPEGAKGLLKNGKKKLKPKGEKKWKRRKGVQR